MQKLASVRTFALVLSVLCALGSAFAQERPARPRAEAAPSEGAPSEGAGQAADPKQAKPKKARQKPGIPVDDVLVQSLCGRCHTRDDREHMTRISYVRKSPEGWARTIKRMGRLHGPAFHDALDAQPRFRAPPFISRNSHNQENFEGNEETNA